MTAVDNPARVNLEKEIGSLLMLRGTVSPLFKKIARLDAPQVIIDFSGVQFMSRSFADEYLAAKATVNSKIVEQSMPTEVKNMLELVSSQHVSGPRQSIATKRGFRRARVVTL